MCKSNNDKTVSTELIFQSMLGTHAERQKANARLRRQGLPASLRMRCRHRGALVRSKLGVAAARWQRKQQPSQDPLQFSPFQTARVDETDWTRRQANDPFSRLPNGWNVLHNVNDLLSGADYASGLLGGVQIGMLKYRQSLPISSRVIRFSKFSQTFRWMGTASRGLGRVSRIGLPLNTYLDYNAMRQGRISETRFIYRTTGTGTSLVTALVIGGSAGAGWGAAVAFMFWGGEAGYDLVSKIVDEFVEGVADAERALNLGTWVPFH